MRCFIFIVVLLLAGCSPDASTHSSDSVFSGRSSSSCEKGLQSLKPGIDFTPGKVLVRFNTKDQDLAKQVLKDEGHGVVDFQPGWYSTQNQLAHITVPEGEEFSVVCSLDDHIIDDVDLVYIRTN
ncbi:hypothetical protein JW968_04710 [Candidatus Woesearchaeota archaeon]|nr:hypothetical protein [Candidatus Woesearchaeota archaeon]